MIVRAELERAIPELLSRIGQEQLLGPWAASMQSARLKAPGEWVTDADLAAESALAEALARLTPGIPLVGEEAASGDPGLLESLDVPEWLWLLDPLDGTAHFARGESTFGMMLALLRYGRACASWVYLPVSGRLISAWSGRGALLDGQHVRLSPRELDRKPRGVVLTRFFSPEMKARAESSNAWVRSEGTHKCAAQRVFDLIEGEVDFAVYWRTLPWDHVPGALTLQEAGAVVGRLDGSEYRAADVESCGLILARDQATWDLVRAQLGEA